MYLGFNLGLSKKFPSAGGGGGGGGPDVYASWATTGTATAVTGYTYASALNGTDIAILQSGVNKLETYRWGGSSFSLVGNSLTDAKAGPSGIVKLTTTRVAVMDQGANDIEAYDFDGTDWSSAATAQSLTITNYPDASYLADNEFVLINNGTMQSYTYSAGTFSTKGNSLALTGDYQKVTALTSTRVAVHDVSVAGDTLKIYDFDGTDWAQVGNTYVTGSNKAGSFGIEALSSTQFVYWDGASTAATIQTMTFDGTNITTQGSSSSLTGAASWPRTIAKMSSTLIVYTSFGDADFRAAEATLS